MVLIPIVLAMAPVLSLCLAILIGNCLSLSETQVENSLGNDSSAELVNRLFVFLQGKNGNSKSSQMRGLEHNGKKVWMHKRQSTIAGNIAIFINPLNLA